MLLNIGFGNVVAKDKVIAIINSVILSAVAVETITQRWNEMNQQAGGKK